MGILLLHQRDILVLQLVDHKDALRFITEFHERLKNATTIVFEAELWPLRSDVLNALLDEFVLLRSRHLLLLHQQFVVANLNTYAREVSHEVDYLLLAS